MKAGGYVPGVSRPDCAVDMSTSFHENDKDMVILRGNFVECLLLAKLVLSSLEGCRPWHRQSNHRPD